MGWKLSNKVAALCLAGIAAVPCFAAKGKKCSEVLSPPQQTKLTPVQHWENAGMGLTQLELLIEPSRCRASQQRWVNCLTAFDELLRNGEVTRRLLPNSLLDEYRGQIDSIERDYGSAKIVRLKPDGRGAAKMEQADIVRRDVRRARQYPEALKELFGRKIDVQQIRNDVYAFVQSGDREAFQAAAALNAVFELDDPHAHLELTALEEEIAVNRGDKTTVGLGVMISAEKKGIIVDFTERGSPAEKAGLKPGDRILAIDGNDVTKLNFGAASALIEGPENSAVELKVERDRKILVLKAIRKPLIFPNVAADVIRGFGPPVGLIELNSFNTPTACDDVRAAIEKVERHGAKRLILDLRGNGGGMFDQTLCIAGLFLGKVLIASLHDLKDSTSVEFRSTTAQITDLPLVVLVNGQSASGSEALAGALRDHLRAWLLGETTFGKGTLQSAIGYDNPDEIKAKILLYMTTHRFHQPSGSSNQLVGIEPHFTVYRTPLVGKDPTPREVDLYANAIPGSKETWTETRAEEVSFLKDCLKREGKAKQLWLEKARNREYADFQLLSAIDLLNCQH